MIFRGTGAVRRERDHALVRTVQLEAQLQEAREARDRLRHDLTAAQQTLERVIDNALFAAGAAPVFHPEDARFQPRTRELQAAEAAAAGQRPTLSPAAWRRQVETIEAERAARDRKASLVDELRREAQQRQREQKQEISNGDRQAT
jgi:hypothetical protein